MTKLFFRLLVASATHGPHVFHRFLLRLRNLIVRLVNPTVNWQIGAHRCEIPLGHDLPLVLARHPQYSGFIVRVAEWIAPRVADLTCVDVGANIGDTALMLHERVKCPVLCIEGNPSYASLLRRNVSTLAGVEIVEILLGEIHNQVSVRLVASQGSCVVVEDAQATALRTETLDDVVSARPRFQNAKLLKIDTDGFDLAILRGASAFLTHAKPVVIFEYDPHHLRRVSEDGLTVFPYLRGHGYTFALFYDNIGDLMLGVDLNQTEILVGLHEYFCGCLGSRYADICVFHGDDAALAAGFHAAERAWFAPLRRLSAAPEDGASRNEST